MSEIHGVCDERFKAVREALAESLDKDDVGASAAGTLAGYHIGIRVSDGNRCSTRARAPTVAWGS